jgi:hypothetical protein
MLERLVAKLEILVVKLERLVVKLERLVAKLERLVANRRGWLLVEIVGCQVGEIGGSSW